MNWTSGWVKLFIREEGSFARLPLVVRGLAAEMLKCADREGRIHVGDQELEDVIAFRMGATRSDRRALKVAVPLLLADGYIVRDGQAVFIRNYGRAQTGGDAAATRQRTDHDGVTTTPRTSLDGATTAPRMDHDGATKIDSTARDDTEPPRVDQIIEDQIRRDRSGGVPALRTGRMMPRLGGKSVHFLRVSAAYPNQNDLNAAADAFQIAGENYDGGEAALAERMLATFSWQLKLPEFADVAPRYVPKLVTYIAGKDGIGGRRWEDPPPATRRNRGPEEFVPEPSTKVIPSASERAAIRAEYGVLRDNLVAAKKA